MADKIQHGSIAGNTLSIRQFRLERRGNTDTPLSHISHLTSHKASPALVKSAGSQCLLDLGSSGDFLLGLVWSG